MENINSASELIDSGLVDAQTLRDMTLTKEQLFAKQKNEVLQSLMSSMVSHATSNGGLEYSAQLNPLFDKTLLNELVEEFKTLNYTTEVTDGTLAEQPTLLLHISWKKNEVSDRSEDK